MRRYRPFPWWRRLRRPALGFALLLLVALGGCSSSTATATRPLASIGCPKAAADGGHMGVCAPADTFKPLPPKLARKLTTAHPITFSDRSNNDPTLHMAAIRAAGHPAIELKVNQGTGFIDQWFIPQVRAARGPAHLAVGGYDFVSLYSPTEAFFFLGRLNIAGVRCTSANTLPPTLDVEYGSATRAGVQAMVDVLERACGRAMIYTGGWYWTPRLGCWWPRGDHLYAWLSGYPIASLPCGIPARAWVLHQFTDHGCDGASCRVDMSAWRPADGWASFARTGPSKRTLERELHAQLLWRTHLRRVLHAHQCRTVHRHETRPTNCVLTLRRGDAANRRIRSLRNQIKES